VGILVGRPWRRDEKVRIASGRSCVEVGRGAGRADSEDFGRLGRGVARGGGRGRRWR
jgi:hypothetical protein